MVSFKVALLGRFFTISELPLASSSTQVLGFILVFIHMQIKLIFMQLVENRPRFEKEAKGSSEMA